MVVVHRLDGLEDDALNTLRDRVKTEVEQFSRNLAIANGWSESAFDVPLSKPTRTIAGDGGSLG